MSELSQAKDSRMTWQRLLLIQLVIGWGAGCIALWVIGQILAGWLLYGGVLLGLALANLRHSAKHARPEGAES